MPRLTGFSIILNFNLRLWIPDDIFPVNGISVAQLFIIDNMDASSQDFWDKYQKKRQISRQCLMMKVDVTCSFVTGSC